MNAETGSRSMLSSDGGRSVQQGRAVRFLLTLLPAVAAVGIGCSGSGDPGGKSQGTSATSPANIASVASSATSPANNDTSSVANSPAFVSFANHANLSAQQRATIAASIDLYRQNAAAIKG